MSRWSLSLFLALSVACATVQDAVEAPTLPTRPKRVQNERMRWVLPPDAVGGDQFCVIEPGPWPLHCVTVRELKTWMVGQQRASAGG